MTLRKQSQPQPPAAQPSRLPPLSLPDWPPDQDRIEHSVRECLSNGDWSRYDGLAAQRLKKFLADQAGATHVRLVSSGTAAVELALRGCRVGPGDEVIVAAFDYPGNFRSVEATGATAVVVDVAANRWTVDVATIAEAVTERTRAIVASHLYGTMTDAAAIRSLADRHGFLFVEDACQSPGARLANRPAGSWGHVGTFSFGGSKLLSCGNGGALFTNDARIDSRMKIFAERPSDAFAMSQLQAAALIPQWESLDFWTERRRRAVRFLRTALEDRRESASRERTDREHRDPWCWGRPEPQDAESAYYKLAWRVADRGARDRLLHEARHLGLPIGPGFPLIARRPSSRRRIAGSLQNSEKAADTTVVLDHRALAGDDDFLRRVAEALFQLQMSESP